MKIKVENIEESTERKRNGQVEVISGKLARRMLYKLYPFAEIDFDAL